MGHHGYRHVPVKVGDRVKIDDGGPLCEIIGVKRYFGRYGLTYILRDIRNPARIFENVDRSQFWHHRVKLRRKPERKVKGGPGLVRRDKAKWFAFFGEAKKC